MLALFRSRAAAPWACARARALHYDSLTRNVSAFRDANGGRALSAAEKIVYGHLVDPRVNVARGETYLQLRPDRVALQDASAQTAVLQFMLTGLGLTAVPTSIHCDHLIVASGGAESDVAASVRENREVFEFLESASRKYGISFWRPGSGIIHQIVLENMATPGGLLIGCDSHTPNAGGLCMAAVGVGGADAVDAMSGMSWELRAPRLLGVRLTGRLNAWATPKDVILSLAGRLTVKGGTGYIVEYFGPGVNTLSATGMATICNMGAEIGATCSLFPYTAAMSEYLRATGRSSVADASDKVASKLLCADAGCEYDKVIDLDLGAIEPRVNGPFTPDLSTPISGLRSAASENGWPSAVSAALIGSCTNSSYEDMARVAALVRQARERGLRLKTDLFVTPGSERIRATCERDGILRELEGAGARILANACGPCIGQWDRTGVERGQKNSILSSFNRNFAARNDGNPGTHNFLASPEIVTAMAFAGTLNFNPLVDELVGDDGRPFRFEAPAPSRLPPSGLSVAVAESAASADSGAAPTVSIDPKSQRLQALTPFPSWDGHDFHDLAVLIKVAGKCTTDHISAAGAWLKYKGHLDNIAENTLIGAVNADNGKVNSVFNRLNGKYESVPSVARQYKAAGIRWIVIGDENYGEGSAREHAAMQPRHLGGVAIICRSFARIHETNLKKQGILPLTFAEKPDYDKVGPRDVVSIIGLEGLTPESRISMRVKQASTGDVVTFPLVHTLSQAQIDWFKAGSALNFVAQSRTSGTR